MTLFYLTKTHWEIIGLGIMRFRIFNSTSSDNEMAMVIGLIAVHISGLNFQ